MSSGETVSRSLLDKPLHQLTEDDISQVTREDCRRYLKEKGMRRPSWNKSQAIQQVICLKTLLETATDSEATEARKKLYSVPPHSTVTVPCRGQDTPKPDLSGDSSRSSRLAADNESVSPRTTVAASESVGQMTIFYSGKVNVYDEMPTEKVRAILQLAASPLPRIQKGSSDVTKGLPSVSFQQTACLSVGPSSAVLISPTLQTGKGTDNCQHPQEENYISCEDSLDGPNSRKASVQRYREKRKDRFKNKRKTAVPSSRNMDIYLNRWVEDQFANEKLNLGDICSTPEIRPSHTSSGCGLVDNTTKISNLSVDPNDKDVEEN